MADEKKIIIDEDWKSQVEAEKAASKQPATTSATSAPSDASAAESDDFPMPPATFDMLLSTIVTEAMIALGQVPHPVDGKASVRPHQAKYFIDTLEMLREKTKGNLTGEESQVLELLLHQLRLAFVQLTTGAGAASVGEP